MTKIYELLVDEKNWTRGAFARTENGVHINPNHPEAVCWCLMGAKSKCYSDGDYYDVTRKILNAFKVKFGENYKNVYSWNDANQTTHADIVNFCKELDI